MRFLKRTLKVLLITILVLVVEGFLTIMIYPDLEESSFEIFREKDESTTVYYSNQQEQLLIELKGKKVPHILNVQVSQAPGTVQLDGAPLDSAYVYDPSKSKLMVRTDEYSSGKYIITF